MPALTDQVAVVTGASSGIGEATAHSLAHEGAAVVLAARREDRLNELKDALEADGHTALVVPTDVTKREQMQHLVDQTTEHFGRLDIFVNNAGIMPLSMMENLHEDEWEWMVDVNVKGVLYGVGAALPVMIEQGGGHFVNVSSVAGRRLFPGGAVYCGTKFFVRALSYGMRNELGPTHGIRVTSIEPGAVATELTDTITDDDVMEAIGPLFDEMEILESEDIAASIRYAVTAPKRTAVDEILIMPTDQAGM
jgi:NADP-dependent 3-hydroxy acid dehydrogenase YdfG